MSLSRSGNHRQLFRAIDLLERVPTAMAIPGTIGPLPRHVAPKLCDLVTVRDPGSVAA
jgi:hypothetical protein